MLKSYYGPRIFIEISLPCSAGIVFSSFFLFDFRCEAAGSRERRVWASKIVCFVTFSCWDAIMARGLFAQSCSHAARGVFLQCNFFRFDFGSIKASIEKGIEKGAEEVSKLEILSVLGYDWGDEARGQ